MDARLDDILVEEVVIKLQVVAVYPGSELLEEVSIRWKLKLMCPYMRNLDG